MVVKDWKQRQLLFRRAQRGLFAGKLIQFGNQISEHGNKTRRTWLPNASWHNHYSQLLGKVIGCVTSTAALRTIDKYGGLDSYILKTPPKKLQSIYGEKLKRDLLAVGTKKLEDVFGPGEVWKKYGIIHSNMDYLRSDQRKSVLTQLYSKLNRARMLTIAESKSKQKSMHSQ